MPAQIFMDSILFSQIQDSSKLECQVPKELGGPVTLKGTGFPFRRFLRLTGPRLSIRSRHHALASSIDKQKRGNAKQWWKVSQMQYKAIFIWQMKWISID
jgi:hypothetical protein